MQAKRKQKGRAKAVVGFAIPRELHARIMRERRGSFANFSEYVRHLIRQDLQNTEVQP